MNTFKRLSRLAIAALPFLIGLDLKAQTVTPNTTLCAAVSTVATSVCLAAVTGVVNQTGLYVDNEYMLVQLSNSQVLTGTNVYVPVSRANRAGKGAITSHATSAIVWVALTPGASAVPGANGFSLGTAFKQVGTCTRASEIYLPVILPDLGMKRDCSASGVWVPYNDFGDPQVGTVQALTTNGAVPVASGIYVITKAGVLADTLAAPTAGIQDGMVIRISSTTANAHTLTATGLFQCGTASVNLATFAASAGAGLTLMAFNGKWVVMYSVGITFS